MSRRAFLVVLVAALLALASTALAAPPAGAGNSDNAPGTDTAPGLQQTQAPTAPTDQAPTNNNVQYHEKAKTVTSTTTQIVTSTKKEAAQTVTSTTTQVVTSTKEKCHDNQPKTITVTQTTTQIVPTKKPCPPPKHQKCPVNKPATCPPLPPPCVISPFLNGQIKLKFNPVKDTCFEVAGAGTVTPLGWSKFSGKLCLSGGRVYGSIDIQGPTTSITILVSAQVDSPDSLAGEWYYVITAGASGVGNAKVTVDNVKHNSLWVNFGV